MKSNLILFVLVMSLSACVTTSYLGRYSDHVDAFPKDPACIYRGIESVFPKADFHPDRSDTKERKFTTQSWGKRRRIIFMDHENKKAYNVSFDPKGINIFGVLPISQRDTMSIKGIVWGGGGYNEVHITCSEEQHHFEILQALETKIVESCKIQPRKDFVNVRQRVSCN